jgi:hypothetical protein
MASFESKVIGRCVPDFKNECFKTEKNINKMAERVGFYFPNRKSRLVL